VDVQTSALRILNCSTNYLFNIDVSNNSNLEKLYVNKNGLATLDLSNNLYLKEVNCATNLLTKIDLGEANFLTKIECQSNQIESLDFSKVKFLEYLNCTSNQLNSIDLSNNKKLNYVRCSGNNNLIEFNIKNGANSRITTFYGNSNNSLMCIQVDNEQAANAGIGNYSGWYKDTSATYSEDCGATAGIDDEILTEGLNLYPNPASNMLSIQSKLPLEKVEIYSILGKKVKDIESGFNSISLDNLSKGIYILRIHSENGTTVRKLIKE